MRRELLDLGQQPRQVALQRAEIADLLWALFLGNLDASETRTNLELPALAAAEAARSSLALIEGSLRLPHQMKKAA